MHYDLDGFQWTLSKRLYQGDSVTGMFTLEAYDGSKSVTNEITYKPKIWALYYGQGELYGMSTNLDKLEQKKKDLEILYELALAYQNDCFKAMEVLGEKYKLSDLMEYEKECEKYTKSDRNIRFYNLKIVEIPNL